MASKQHASTSVLQQNTAMALSVDTFAVSPPNTCGDAALQPPSMALPPLTRGGVKLQAPSTMLPPNTRGVKLQAPSTMLPPLLPNTRGVKLQAPSTMLPPLLPNTRDEVALQPPSSDQDFDVINGQLVTTHRIIEAARKEMWSNRGAAEEERKLRLQCSNAYKNLHTQHGSTLQDLRDASSKCVSLQQQFDEARGTISNYESTVEDYEGRLNNHANLAQMAEHEAARANRLESSVRQLEKEKTDRQKYQVAFSNAANRLSVAQQKISELEMENEGMVQDHHVAVATAASQLSAAKQKIGDLEMENEGMVQDHHVAVATAANQLSAAKQKIGDLEMENEGMVHDHHVAVATAAYRISGAERKIEELEQKAGKRQRPNEDGPATRGRKRRAVQIGGEEVGDGNK